MNTSPDKGLKFLDCDAKADSFLTTRTHSRFMQHPGHMFGVVHRGVLLPPPRSVASLRRNTQHTQQWVMRDELQSVSTLYHLHPVHLQQQGCQLWDLAALPWARLPWNAA